jgi:hypothetical protein
MQGLLLRCMCAPLPIMSMRPARRSRGSIQGELVSVCLTGVILGIEEFDCTYVVTSYIKE